MNMQDEKNKEKAKQVIRIVLIVIISIALVFSICKNVKLFIDRNKLLNYDKFLTSLKQQKDENGLESLKSVNNDICAWISIKDIDVELPIVKTNSEADEEFYLSHDIEKHNNVLGCPYQKSTTELGVTTNTVFVGHSGFVLGGIFGSSTSQVIFGKINDYTTNVSSSLTYIIEVETLTEKLQFQIFSILRYKADDTQSPVYGLYNTVDIATQEQFENFVNIAIANSIYALKGTPTFGDKFLTLYTCSSNLEYRTMIIAKQI